MKINPKHLKNFLRQDFKKFKAAIIVGNNEKLISEVSDQLCEHLIVEDQDGCNKVRISAPHLAINFHVLINEARTASLFGSNKVIIINDVTQPSLFILLKDFCQTDDLSDGLFLIMSCSRIMGDSIKAFFETSNHIAVLPCYLDNTDRLEQSLGELDCDIYVALMFEKKFLQAELVLEKLIFAGTKSTQVIRCALRYYNQLYIAHGLLCDGVPFDQVASLLKPRVFFKYASAFNAALKGHSVPQVLHGIEQLIRLEITSKAGDTQNAWVVCHKKLYEILSI